MPLFSASLLSSEFSLTKCDTSAICTPNTKLPFSLSFKETASSKSFACSPSIVMIFSARKSTLSLIVCSHNTKSFASFSTSIGKFGNKPKFLALQRMSTPTSFGLPRTSVILPSALRLFCARFVISATTFCPFFTPLAPDFGINTSSICMASSITNTTCFCTCAVPTIVTGSSDKILITLPSKWRPPVCLLFSLTTTSSPLIAPFCSLSPTKISSYSCAVRKKA